MGAGVHGGFGATIGARNSGVVAADSALVGNGKGSALAAAAKKVKKEPGYTDVAVHGSPNSISVFRKTANGEQEIILDQRRLANYLKHDKGYSSGKIRLLSCRTGAKTGTFAQNLANKMGVIVRAPSDTLYIYPNGRTVIGPDQFTDSGHWIDYYPQGRGRRKS